MTEIPEHLLQRSKERRKALGLPVPGEEEGAAESSAAGRGAGRSRRGRGGPGRRAGRRRQPRRSPSATSSSPGAGGSPRTCSSAAATGGSRSGSTCPARRQVAARPAPKSRRRPAGARAATATATLPAPTVTGPGGHTQRLLTVVKSGSIQETRAEAQDKVHTWPHLLVVEFASLLIVTAGLTIFSAAVRAPLLQLADFNKTPNPSKAPWYFLGLQELLTMFHPMIAGVTIPGMGLFLLGVAPFVDKNPSHLPKDRKFAIAIFTIFVMLWAVLVIIGSFFRGPGFNFVFPWNDGIFFEL